jgi:hypothetical protein
VKIEAEDKAEIGLNSAWCRFKTDAAILVSIDTVYKYPQLLALSSEEVYFIRSEGDQTATMVRLAGLSDDWRVEHAWGGRYTINFLIVNKLQVDLDHDGQNALDIVSVSR